MDTEIHFNYPTTNSLPCTCLDCPEWIRPCVVHCSRCMVESSASPDGDDHMVLFSSEEFHMAVTPSKVLRVIVHTKDGLGLSEPYELEHITVNEFMKESTVKETVARFTRKLLGLS